jgi:hypothetical protein
MADDIKIPNIDTGVPDSETPGKVTPVIPVETVIAEPELKLSAEGLPTTSKDCLTLMSKILKEEGDGYESNIGVTSQYWVLKNTHHRLKQEGL